MPTSQEIRAIVRAELRRLLAHAVDSFPPDPSPSSDSADPGLDGALGAWETLATGHRQGATVGEAMAAGRANPAAWGALCGALGLEEGARDGRRVGMALARLAGRAGVAGRRLVGRMDRTKVRRWRVEGRVPSSALAAPFDGFRFASPADRDTALAAALTLLARPVIVGPVPAFVFSGDEPGLGTSTLADVVAVLGMGRVAPRLVWPSAERERERVLGAVAAGGEAAVVFDGATGFGGLALARCLTASSVAVRRLGSSEVTQIQWRCVVMATGVGVGLDANMARRARVCRLSGAGALPSTLAVEEGRGEWVAAALSAMGPARQGTWEEIVGAAIGGRVAAALDVAPGRPFGG